MKSFIDADRVLTAVCAYFVCYMLLLKEIACDNADSTRLPLLGTISQQCSHAQDFCGLDQANLASIDWLTKRGTEADTAGKSSRVLVRP